ncbi:hypothetical protein B0H12DRAFT_1083624 [Mycena haematopus]|nr:hypothetical protein B0H12DRAFT_1083624 [Mycena haematopus]
MSFHSIHTNHPQQHPRSNPSSLPYTYTLRSRPRHRSLLPSQSTGTSQFLFCIFISLPTGRPRTTTSPSTLPDSLFYLYARLNAAVTPPTDSWTRFCLLACLKLELMVFFCCGCAGRMVLVETEGWVEGSVGVRCEWASTRMFVFVG